MNINFDEHVSGVHLKTPKYPKRNKVWVKLAIEATERVWRMR